MIIVADANIVDVKQRYSRHGELRLLNGREIRAADVRDADALLVRSITPVNAALLEGSRVQFVATATSGTDHLDLDWLHSRGIRVADAAGSNANAVVEYVLCALAELTIQGLPALASSPVGIVGYGHVGRRLYQQLTALGIACRVCDPFVEAQYPGVDFCSLQEAMTCPVLSLHTPLTRDGAHPTFHMVTEQLLSRLPMGAILINAARGELIDTFVLKRFLDSRKDVIAVLDCWEGEPNIDTALLARVRLGSPHIAGYSQQAKRNASERNYQAFQAHFALQEESRDKIVTPAVQDLSLPVPEARETDLLFAQILRTVFPVVEVDRCLRAAQSDASLFDAIRRDLSAREEFSAWRLDLTQWDDSRRTPELIARLRALGFSVQP